MIGLTLYSRRNLYSFPKFIMVCGPGCRRAIVISVVKGIKQAAMFSSSHFRFFHHGARHQIDYFLSLAKVLLSASRILQANSTH
jgi:hypothetical protein